MGELAEYVGRSTRYRKLNLQSYFRYGTLEVRHHGGSLDSYKVEGWLRLQYALLQYAKSHTTLSQANEVYSLSDRDKLNNIVSFSRETARPNLNNLKLRQIKELVYQASGCGTTKELKKAFAKNLDLRKKSSWVQLYNRFVGNGAAFDLNSWLETRTSQLQTTIAG